MKPRNVLQEIIDGTLDEDGADAFLDAVIQYTDDTGVEGDLVWLDKWLGLSRAEWSAIGPAIFTTVANWRENGWPETCFKCGGEIIPEKFGWIVKEVDGQYLLKHTVCPIFDAKAT